MISERQLTLDGVRGLAASAVLISHYLAEIPGGLTIFAFGSLAVNVFFVLSGFLIGRLILTRRDAPNFFKTFYVRRLLRTVPSYVIVVVTVLAMATLLPDWAGDYGGVPAWSYLTFTQNFFFASTQSAGLEWLSPTWTLAVEEQFYLLAPAALVFTPRRFIIPVALMVFVWSGLYRFQMAAAGVPPAEFLPLLLTRADALAAGVIAGALWFHVVGTRRYSRLLEATPLALLLVLLVCVLFLPRKDWEFTIYHSMLAIASAAYILRAAVAASEMKWLEARWLRFMGDNSYSIYLIHMPVAGIVHHLTTGSPPGISTPLQWFATMLATIATLALSRVLTRLVEEPLTAVGRQFHWAKPETSPQPTIA